MPNWDELRKGASVLQDKTVATALHDVDSIVRPDSESPPRSSDPHPKLRRANAVAQKTEEELRGLCEGLSERIAEIGVMVADAYEPHGLREHILTLLGHCGLRAAQHEAAVLRQQRLHTLSLQEAVNEIERYVKQTILDLGESEVEYKDDLTAYERDLNDILKKQADGTPIYLDAKAARESLQTQTKAAEAIAKTAEERERPKAEQQLEQLKRALTNAQMIEATALSVVKEATEAVPEVQKSRDAAAEAIQSLHSMRQSMLEKFSNFKIVLERATTAMRARARIELYESTDPAFNKSIDLITANNIATAGAALEVMADRIKKAAIDPGRSQELLNELLGHISDAAQELELIELNVQAGPRDPVLVGRGRQ